MFTKRQKQILDFIKGYNKKYGYSPSLEEIKRGFHLSSVATVHQHVEALKTKGYLDKQKNQRRSIEVSKTEKLVRIPLLGTIAAGEPIEAVQEKEMIAVPKSKFPHASGVYALRVVGNSMVDENINDGDVVLVRQQETAENGQKVVALIDNHEATLKKFYKERGHIRLQPANRGMEPIILQNGREITIQGIVVDVIRNESTTPINQSKPAILVQQYSKLPLNKIICGDAVAELQKFPNESVDLIVTDPPYGISRELNCKGQRLGTTAKLNFNFGEWDTFNKEWFDIALKKTKGWMMTFCAKKDVGFFIDGLEKNGFIAIDVLVWQKPDPIPLNAKSRFLNAWEAVVIGKRPGAVWNSTYEHNIIKIQAPKGKSRIHPTQKPVELIKKLINLTTKEGDVVLDPFMGSGTTAVACIEAKRNYIGFEISKQYWKQSLDRIENLPKKLF
ncbi:MAG: repressor LexA [Candidatus Sungbacteria bacterium RIFCSPLOWO2_12_FULL_41_11]|uniref:LexA repressor n=1 Tax=Candidatus Sungbacteria bacterium RIFCSPLOWO2_12_FULL_41_11 TaxID=1802286 RepID=A0A1G2LPW1_9BACT|nr:MAG: LexA repressor [Parcubacteria group bacterium GW2011_GWA2_42_14]OGZ97522.1 MAG: repressor LexA [Candidatus Sungbacteria bacterium RIFCSPHIGHO2_02_FULL_41_12b]OHA12919.1 MAG: repressor LexA [Candidatus Sungbacteria bacterium RIFCSPLOWO2_12_FULL_41_11]